MGEREERKRHPRDGEYHHSKEKDNKSGGGHSYRNARERERDRDRGRERERDRERDKDYRERDRDNRDWDRDRRDREPVDRNHRDYRKRARSKSVTPEKHDGKRKKEAQVKPSATEKPQEQPPQPVALEPLADEEDMMKSFGIPLNFDSTKGKCVPDANQSAVKLASKRQPRQYMNRRGGFNRPLPAELNR
ncbi:hypothetical protein SELMODRAFT_438561 [Selaginella moellendorffii]|uniref:U4/U6.U5 small nuclear ribonucleoprotein 27kDa protein domain-containing protein n=1 Tax=Selaginella moellendorffii TaxID=88036 RepID=D8QWR5_SELML|nr:U4/U6.U5 small nuclear ribonucleoprotein 27 kDa protein [Selaginella moellendorffii]XP_024524010.1 U4/U6.U5 small nuclear ribonucleoprotein 27 kDa protein [Selaginella moellendorffii]EFJ35682.1 hypothetical protein SELMODRAFT_438561 [Selaginella moellendorffii]|eukprot:XP_002963811.1 U4/U6.U5 small nuclear ribonucleoprotein 27 kDa protein [Selaginella moellendorffii]